MTIKERRESGIKRAKEIEGEINALGYWDTDLNRELCELAGVEDEYDEADGETFEAVVYKAANIMGIEI